MTLYRLVTRLSWSAPNMCQLYSSIINGLDFEGDPACLGEKNKIITLCMCLLLHMWKAVCTHTHACTHNRDSKPLMTLHLSRASNNLAITQCVYVHAPVKCVAVVTYFAALALGDVFFTTIYMCMLPLCQSMHVHSNVLTVMEWTP